MSISNPISQNPQLSLSKNKHRTKGHEALLKLKETDRHLDILKKRQKYWQVRDEDNRSKTIQHERKISLYQMYQEEAKKERQQLERYSILKMYEVESTKQKNLALKDKIEKKIREQKQKAAISKGLDYRDVKAQQESNEKSIRKQRQEDSLQKQQRRKSVNNMEKEARLNVSRYKENKFKQTQEMKGADYDTFMTIANSKEKQLEELSKMEELMIKKNSESLQISQTMRNRLKEVLGDDRRFTKLPSIRSKNLSTRGSSDQTQIIIL